MKRWITSSVEDRVQVTLRMKLDQDPEAPTPARRSGSLMDAAITAPGLFRDTTWKEVRGPYEKERQAGRHCGSKS